MRLLHLRSFISTFIAVGLASGLASGQKTWIVDKNNGPGTHYTDLPPAVAAAAHGDTIILRSGTYNATTIGKGLAILGRSGAVIRAGFFIGPPLRINGIPAGKIFRMRNVRVQDQLLALNGVLEIKGNLGSVHLQGVTVSTTNVHPRGPVMRIQDSKAVTLNSCASPTGCTISGSKVMINGGSYHGTNAYTQWGHGCWDVPSSAALIVSSSTVQMTQLQVTGGNGHASCWSTNPPIAGSPAVKATGSRILALGSSSTLSAGSSSPYALVGASSSSLVLDPGVTLNPKPGHSGFTTVALEKRPVLTVSGGALGGSLQATLTSPKGHFFVFYESLPWIPVPVAHFGEVWLDHGYLILLGVGLQDATGQRSFNLPIPNLTVFRGVPILMQGWGGTTLGNFRYSNAVVSVLD
ncbi:MAG: hypothetical protein ACE5F1_13045 [Planctomycetota bacterium]